MTYRTKDYDGDGDLLTAMPIPPKDNSKSLGLAWGIIAGVVLLLAAVGLFCIFIAGLKTGETMKWSQYHPGLDTRQDHPGQFWFSEMATLIFGFLLGWLAVWILRDTLRQLRRR